VIMLAVDIPFGDLSPRRRRGVGGVGISGLDEDDRGWGANMLTAGWISVKGRSHLITRSIINLSECSTSN
jgi:hypothetical protein